MRLRDEGVDGVSVALGGDEGLGEGVHGVLQGVDAVDGLTVLGSEFDLAIVCMSRWMLFSGHPTWCGTAESWQA